MAYSAVALMGIAAWRNIPIESLPDTQLPQLTVTATWRGTSPETVEAFLTSPLEATVQQVRGVRKVTSTSSEGQCTIQVQFSRDTDMDFARLDLSERLSMLEEDLPYGVDPIRVQPYVPREFQDQSRPFLSYTLTGPYTVEALRQYAVDVLAPELEQVDGVAQVDVQGGRNRLLEIRLDREKISALGLTPSVVSQAIADLDLVREAGVVRQGGSESTITIVNQPGSAADVRSAVLVAKAGTLVRVSDVASVHDTYEEATSYHRINGRPAVSFDVRKEIGTNTVHVADAVKARVAQLQHRKPYGSRVILDFDQSKSIRAQLSDLRTRAIFSALVIFVVLLGFLRSLRSSTVIFATIAFSVLIALNLIYFGGLTLNLLTLMGLAMGFGLIVDNSIVVLENVYRRWQAGEDTRQAAEIGAREVVLPILASTATTLIVFVPFVYLQGENRVYYVPLGIVVALTLIASLLVAFTFIPALASRLLTLRGRGERGAGAGTRSPFYVRFYAEIVSQTVRHPWASLFVTVVIFGSSYYLFNKYVTVGAMWGGSYGEQTYIDVDISMPRGSDLGRADELTRFFEDKIAGMPEVGQYETDVMWSPAASRSTIRVTFPDSLENTAVPVAIKEQMVAYSHQFTGADVRVYGYGPSFYGGGSSAPNYAIQILGYNYQQVRDIAEDLGRRLTHLSRVSDVDTNSSGRYYQRDRASEFAVTIDRTRLARYDLSVQEFVGRLNAAIGGRSGLKRTLKIGGDEVEYDVKLAENRMMDVHALRETLIGTPDGRQVRLGDMVTIESRDVLSRIQRENQQYQRTVAYEFLGPAKLGNMVNDAVIGATKVPPGYTVKKGDSYYFISAEQKGEIHMVIAISLVLVYMVTAALFESLLQPLCVMLTVPFALIGVFLVFFYTGTTFTREAYIGVIMMFGIVVNNAILLVDHVNGVRTRSPGMALSDAIVKGTLERVRPILMTTATTVAGLLPLLLFGKPTGSNIWDALALVLIGGLLSSTLFVLTITPAVYGVLERWKLAARGAEVGAKTTVPTEAGSFGG